MAECQAKGCTETATKQIIVMEAPAGTPDVVIEILADVCDTHYALVPADKQK